MQRVLHLKIRAFETDDTESVLQLANTYAFFDGPMHESDLAISGSFPDGFLIAEDEGHIVGFVMGYLRDFPADVLENWGVSTVGHIEILVVAPPYRERGIATALMKNILDVFKRAGAEMVTLHCPVSAREAKHLYDKLGFSVRAYEMKKRL
jgi:ribosomal protein S18 acetylase RimI-like enzyme